MTEWGLHYVNLWDVKSQQCLIWDGGLPTDTQNPRGISLVKYLSENIAVIILIYAMIKTPLVVLFQNETHRYANLGNKQYLVSSTTKSIIFIVAVI